MSVVDSSTTELHRELIADHTARPRNFREMTGASHQADGHNPTCGDRLTVWVKISNGLLVDVSFKGTGCSIGTSSASMMTEAMKGKTLAEAELLFRQFHDLLTQNVEVDSEQLGKLVAFSGVKRFPVRVKCATLPWHTFHAAINNRVVSVSTEGHAASL